FGIEGLGERRPARAAVELVLAAEERQPADGRDEQTLAAFVLVRTRATALGRAVLRDLHRERIERLEQLRDLRLGERRQVVARFREARGAWITHGRALLRTLRRGETEEREEDGEHGEVLHLATSVRGGTL